MKYWQLLLLILMAQTANAQYPFDHKRDYQWIFGYGDNNQFGLSIFDFNTNINAPISHRAPRPNFYYVATGNSSICDTSGILRFYNNGVALVNGNFEQIDSNSRLQIGSTGSLRYGTYGRDNSVTLPFGDGTDRVRVLHSNNFYNYLNVGSPSTYNNLWNTEIDLSANQGNGSILRLNQTILTDSFNLDGIVSCRHANGRDWWILLWKQSSNQVQRVLSTPYGVRYVGTQLTDSVVANSSGQSMFSPDGSRFAHFRTTDGVTSFLDLFDFDRCTGMLSNQRRHRLPNPNTTLLSCCFSPNSQLLYLGDAYKVYQINLAQPSSMIFTNIDTVAVNDGIFNSSGWPISITYQQLGPNGKIYMGGGGNRISSCHP